EESSESRNGREGRTGIFFDKLTVESLSSAIAQLNNCTIEQSACVKQAMKFSKERFKARISLFVKQAISK
ncbi:MAG: hypothetical protein AAB907_04130, partial [Patescibacteria group bacterium]